MKELDCVEVIAEKNEYAMDGVHKGMQGWICLDDNVNGTWLVNFPQYGEKDDIAEISIKETDLKVIPVMDVRVNEEIKARFEGREAADEPSAGAVQDRGGYFFLRICMTRPQMPTIKMPICIKSEYVTIGTTSLPGK